MKAYLVKHAAPLPPFRKPASQVSFQRGTFRQRLERQLAAAGLEVVAVDEVDPARVAARSLVLSDHVVLSDSFLGKLLASLPDPRGRYEVEIETSRFPMLASKSAKPRWKKLPIRYHGDDAGEFQPLRLQPQPVLEVSEGVPARMQALTDIGVCFFDFFGVALDYWFDLHAASSLCTRELVAKLVGPFHGRVPAPILARFTGSPWLMGKCNRIGRRCRIHSTAILEGCVIGDDVEIGPFAYLRSSVVADRAVLREKSSAKTSYIGTGAFVMSSDVVNSYVGAETSIFTPMLYNVVFGERGFLSGGSGFADFIVGAESIPAFIDGVQVPSGLPFLGSAVGDDCFIGANLIFAPGRTIPDGTRLLDHGLIKSVPTKPDGTYVVSNGEIVQIPEAFLARKGA